MQKQRIVYVDAIKVFLTFMVVAHHAGQAYGPTGGAWPISDARKTSWLGSFFFINASYMMGLYFFISGYFMLFSLNRKTRKQFVQDRLVRLGIPLVFFTLFVFLPFNYVLSDGKQSISGFLIDTYLHHPPIATGHLWFVASLLLYSLIYLLFSGKSANSVEQPTRAKAMTFRVYYVWLYILGLTVVTGLVRLQYPVDVWRTWLIPVEVAHIPQYLSLFFLGAIFNRNQWLDSVKFSTGLMFLGLAILGILLNNFFPGQVRDFWLTESCIESLCCVGLSMGLLSLCKRYANKVNALLQLLSDNAYGIYLFHVFIVIAIQQALLPWGAGANIKFVVVTLLSFLCSLGVTVSLRRIAIIRKVV